VSVERAESAGLIYRPESMTAAQIVRLCGRGEMDWWPGAELSTPYYCPDIRVSIENRMDKYINPRALGKIMGRREVPKYMSTSIIIVTIVLSIFFLALIFLIVEEADDNEPTEFSFQINATNRRDSNESVQWDITYNISNVKPRPLYESGLWREFGLRIQLKDGTYAYQYARFSTFPGNYSTSPAFYSLEEDHLKVVVGDSFMLSGLDRSYEGAKIQFIHIDEVMGTFRLPNSFS
jgi:hypothetical protein